MKDRLIEHYGTRRTVDVSSTGVVTASQSNAIRWWESLSVIADWQGKPASRSINHANEFVKQTLTPFYVGNTVTTFAGGSSSSTSGILSWVFSKRPSLNTGVDSVLYNDALSQLNDQIRGKVDLAISVAEAHQTLQMKRQFDRAVWKAFTAIGGFRRRFGADLFKSVREKGTNAWLTWTYGISPLINDVYNTASNLRRCLVDGQTVKVRKSSTESVESKVSPALNPQDPLNHSRESVAETVSRRVEISVTFALPDSLVQKIGDWTSLNPASIAWELTPYSFVIDWFVDVGSYLRNFESALLYGPSFKKGYVTYGSKASVQSRYTGDYQNVYGDHYTAAYMGSYLRSWKRRTPLASWPKPKLPGVKVDLGWRRLMSAASLIYQGGKKNRNDYVVLQKPTRFERGIW